MSTMPGIFQALANESFAVHCFFLPECGCPCTCCWLMLSVIFGFVGVLMMQVLLPHAALTCKMNCIVVVSDSDEAGMILDTIDIVPLDVSMRPKRSGGRRLM